MFGFVATRCAKCEKGSFKAQELSFKGSDRDYRVISIQCASCKTPIGIIDSSDAQQQQARISSIERRLASMKADLADMKDRLSEIAFVLLGESE
jgi:hypothetical protein